MRARLWLGWTAALALCLSSCGSSITLGPQPPGTPNSRIEHLVVIVQENHTFDNYFGAYCTAPAGSDPACNHGPACCEAAPAKDPNGFAPIVLDDASNGARDPNHEQSCELSQINGGAMDGFTVGQAGCANPQNFAVAGDAAKPYWDLAKTGALADRYFQPVAGQSSMNDMYFASAKFVFLDNMFAPDFALTTCGLNQHTMVFSQPNLGDMLTEAGVPWAVYAEGLSATRAALTTDSCADPAPACPLGLPIYPCVFDGGDIPYAYFGAKTSDTEHFRDTDALAADIDGQTLPDYSFVKFLGFKTEHPGYGTTISAGTDAVTALVQKIEGSAYANNTLILITWDEGGGYFDHVPPPPTSTIDEQPYGTRIPLIAVGPFAKKNFVSHVTLEHSSIVKFIEWNWLGAKTGQLDGRDTTVHNIGSLLDLQAAGAAVPN